MCATVSVESPVYACVCAPVWIRILIANSDVAGTHPDHSVQGLNLCLVFVCQFKVFNPEIQLVFALCPEWAQGDGTWHLLAIFFLTSRLALKTFLSDWTKFLWKATRACGLHKVISRFTVTLKRYATCRAVNSALPVTDRNWLGWDSRKMGFPVDVSKSTKPSDLEGDQNQFVFRLLHTVMVVPGLVGTYSTVGWWRCYQWMH